MTYLEGRLLPLQGDERSTSGRQQVGSMGKTSLHQAVDVGDAVPRAEIEARFSAATRGSTVRPLPERIRDMPDAELAALAKRLERRQHECGCSAGAWTMWAAVVIAAVAGFVRGASSVQGALTLAALGLAFVLTASAVAKFSAITVARGRWRRDRDVILAQLATVKGAGHVMVR